MTADGEGGGEITVVLTRALVELFPGAPTELKLRAATVDDLVGELDRRWRGMRDRLTDSTPAIRKHLSIFVDGRRARLDTKIPPGSTVYVLTAISGG
jgi:molybdopterin converting factor small subunit